MIAVAAQSAAAAESAATRQDESVTSDRPRRNPALGYLRRWRLLLPELGFLLAVLPVTIVFSVVLWTGIGLGIGTAVLWIGLPATVGTLLLSRRLGEFELARLRAAGRPAVERPDWSARRAEGTLWRRLLAVIADGRTWSYWAHGAIVELVVGSVTWSLALTWSVVALAGPTYWFWGRFVSHGGSETWAHVQSLGWIPGYRPETTLDGLFAGESVYYGVVGGVFLLTLPLVVHGLVLLHEVVARTMLGEGASAVLRREIADSETARGLAILAEDDALRRLERDIHDGPQQSLLRVQFDLSSSLRAVPDGDERLRPLLENALALTKETLEELRDLSRGMAPPLLQDRGLPSAIRSLAARNPVPTTVSLDLPDDSAAAATLERSAYFIVSELLANVAKHSGATAASVTLRIADDRERGLLARRRATLVLEVADNGSGGAAPVGGHGLAGLRARVAGLRGTMAIESPRGGPTRVVVALPLGTPDERSPLR